jgi:diaminopimelate epimerase
VVASILNGKTGRNVTAKPGLGELTIEWNGENVFMTGPAEYVFEGKIDLTDSGYNF